MNRCLTCFHEYSEEYEVCPFCGHLQVTEPREPIELVPGTVLNGRYIVGEAIGSGGFGIIYRAYDTKLETILAVKEFFISRIMTRAQGEKTVIVSKKVRDEFHYRKSRFLDEARTMAKFSDNRSIPNVFEFFEENETAYFTMELLEGQPLNEYLKLQPEGKLDQEFALFIASEVGNALTALHKKGIIHRDVAPDNIFISNKNTIRILLLDLGAAKLEAGTEKVIDNIMKPGYSPAEQYDTNNKNVRPSMDVYALAATTYVMLTGVKPEESRNRKTEDLVKYPQELDNSIPENMGNAVMRGMAVETHLRYQSVKEYISALTGDKKVLSVEGEKKHRRARRMSWVVFAAAVLLILSMGVSGIYQNKKNAELLDDADITIWFSLNENENPEIDGDEEQAIQAIIDDFTKLYPNITITARGILETEYAQELGRAAEEGTLPSLFESTGVSKEILEMAEDVSDILNTSQAQNCYFIDQYENYYDKTKQLPLAVDIPVICAIVTDGDGKDMHLTEYTFEDFSAFGEAAVLYVDEKIRGREYNTFQNLPFYAEKGKEDFENNNDDAAVFVTYTMELNEVYESVQHRLKNYMYYSNGQVYGSYTYEWSVGNCSDAEIAAAKRLLSYMLGNEYQQFLMVTYYHAGQIPVNQTAFANKTDNSIDDMFKGLAEIRDKIVFEK